MPDPGFLKKQTLRNYDYSWGRLQGDPDLRSAFWRNNVDDFLARQELCISPEWFPGRKVLDVGCGGGRWTYGLQKLGCEVTALDASAAAVDFVRSNIAAGSTQAYQANIFDLPREVTEQKYDLVFSWGVLHHTGDTLRALSTIAPLMKPDGVLYIYLYGKKSWGPMKSLLVKSARGILFPFPPSFKFAVFRALLGEYKAGLAMDVLGTTIAHRYTQEEVDGWLQQLGFSHVVRTIATDEIYRKAHRENCSAEPYALEPAAPPYWFEKWREKTTRTCSGVTCTTLKTPVGRMRGNPITDPLKRAQSTCGIPPFSLYNKLFSQRILAFPQPGDKHENAVCRPGA